MVTSSSAHGAAAAASSSSSRSPNRWKHEVFLSFRGEDTRKTFTGHLFIALRNAGINTFVDNQLTRGEKIQRELDREIEGSRIAVIVFSKRYAESRWCLRELTKIMRCLKDQEGKIVCPIFYDVDPSQVRKQEDSFGEAFQKHEKDEDPNEIKQWREDLKASADLVGWNLNTTADGCEGVFIEKIVGDVKRLLKGTDAVSSMVYEASARIGDPVCWCAGAICLLQKQVNELQAQLAKAHADIVNMQCQQANLVALICMEMSQPNSEQGSPPQSLDHNFITTIPHGGNQSKFGFLDDSTIPGSWEPLWT